MSYLKITRTLGFLAALFFPALTWAQAELPIGAVRPAPESYSDVADGHWAYAALRQMTDLGILTGYPDGDFRGDAAARRYEVAIVAARLIDYTDSLINTLGGDSDFATNLRQVARDLKGVADMDLRVAYLEQAVQNAASLTYTRSLEARVVALENALNEQGGTRFPATMTSAEAMPLSAAAATPGGGASFGVARTGPPTGNAPLITLQDDPPHPLYIGFSPGVISSSGGVYFGTQVGYGGLIGPLGVTVRLVFNSGLDELRLSADALVRVQAFTNQFELYGGLGPGVSIRPGGTSALLEAAFGAEYFVTPRVGLFAQVTTSYAFAPLGQVDAQLTSGVNLRF